MGFSIRPLLLFAERRPETLEGVPKITDSEDDGKSISKITDPKDGGMSTFSLETKYGLRLHVFPNGPSIQISSVRLRSKRLRKEMVLIRNRQGWMLLHLLLQFISVLAYHVFVGII